MEITIKEPKLNNKAFTFTDSVRNQKKIAKYLGEDFQKQVDLQEKANDVDAKTNEKSTPEEIIDGFRTQIDEKIKEEQNKIVQIDTIVNLLASIFGLKGKQKEILEDLSLLELGELLGHISIRMDNPAITEDIFWELVKAGESKKSQPEEG